MIKKVIKGLLFVLTGILVLLQFIRPSQNLAEGNSSNDIRTTFNVPPDVQAILQTSCYDCHSSTTLYPWYAELQPVGWWLNNHIQEGQRELNFSEFSGYRSRRQYKKFEEIVDQVKEGEMPLPSYLIVHTDATLLPEQKERLVAWANAMRDSMRALYPIDSLERKR